MADQKAEMDVLSLNIREISKYMGKYVTILVKTPIRELKGLVYTVDPVSQSVVLLTKEDDKLSAEIIFKHAITEITIENIIPQELADVNLSQLFTNRVERPKPADQARKKRVLEWLDASSIPYTEMDGVLTVEGVQIRSPYTAEDCVGDHPIKIKRMQNIISNIMPSSEVEIEGL